MNIKEKYGVSIIKPDALSLEEFKRRLLQYQIFKQIPEDELNKYLNELYNGNNGSKEEIKHRVATKSNRKKLAGKSKHSDTKKYNRTIV